MKIKTIILLLALCVAAGVVAYFYVKSANQKKQAELNQIFQLGEDYYYGNNGKTQDYAEAVKWWRKAAEQGHDKAQNSLGVCYYRGEGVKQNEEEAKKWLRKAAAQGHKDAKNALKEWFGE